MSEKNKIKGVFGMVIIDKPIRQSVYRTRLTQEYALKHYGIYTDVITPQAIIVHWTATKRLQAIFDYFFLESNSNLRCDALNVAAHFLVDRDGSVYRLTAETALNRHTVGYNWCSIGIENVGGVDGKEDLTAEQLTANTELILYLQAKYQTIEYVFGHYQQEKARQITGLYKELVAGYRSLKDDPGPIFMAGLRKRLNGSKIKVL